MTDVRAATTSLLEERPSLESALRELLALDEDGPWTFHDTSLDSGTFGEIVSAGIVEKEGEVYRIVDRDAVRAALDGERASNSTSASDPLSSFDFDRLRGRFDQDATLLLVGALLLVAAFRMFSFPSVFRNGDVVLLGNDPYYYRYWVEQVAAGAGVFDFGALVELPGGVTKGEPLLVATLWFVSSLLGGSTDVIGLVVAWYPVVAAMLTGVFLYVTATTVSGDRRVGLAAVLMLALIPVNAYRTGLGFADHHAFDYLWLALTAVALVKLVSDTEWSWPYAGVLGVAVAGQILAWDNGALLIVPLAFVVPLYAALQVNRDRSPLWEGVPLVAGLALASVLVWSAHTTLGWHTTVVASVPALVLAGSAVVLSLGEVAQRVGVSAKLLLGAEAVGGVGLLVVLPSVLPELSQGLTRGFDRLFRAQNIVETTSLVSGEMGTLVGPLLLLGFIFALGLPYIGWATIRAARQRDPQWLALVVYAWWFFALSLVQLRFAGEFSVFLAVFAGLGFVHLASVVDLAEPVGLFDDSDKGRRRGRAVRERGSELELPSRREAVSYMGFTALVGSLSFVQIPVKFSQLIVEPSEYRAAAWMREYADDKGWSYPQNYVFSSWGMNRMYNYFVNGESRSYAYARNTYDQFLRASDSAAWYKRLKDRVGFVVTSGEVAGGTMAAQLANYGSESEGTAALSHYRLVHTEGSLRVFTLVPGASLVGLSKDGAVTVSTTVEVNGNTFEYSNTVDPNPYDVFRCTVPYPGNYQVRGKNVFVNDTMVSAGEQQYLHDREPESHWPFNTGSGELAYNRITGKPGQIVGATWATNLQKGTALKFNAESDTHVETEIDIPNTFSMSLWIRPETLDSSPKNNYQHLISGSAGPGVLIEENGLISFRIPGVATDFFAGGEVAKEEWTHVAVTFDGTKRRIFINGRLVASKSTDDGDVSYGKTLSIGGGLGDGHGFNGFIDDVRIYGRALSGTELKEITVSGR